MEKKTALVIGISNNIGLEIAKRLSNKYHIIGTYCNSLNIAESLTKLIPDMEIRFLDLASDNSIEELVNEIDKVEIVINTSAIYYDCSIEEKNRLNYLKIMNVNCIGPFILYRSLLKKMDRGNIITITNSIDTYYPEAIDYDSSKAALNIMVKDLALISYPIRMNTILLGWCNSEDSISLDKEYKNQEENKILMTRFCNASKVSQLVDSIIDNQYLHSSEIRLDGGFDKF